MMWKRASSITVALWQVSSVVAAAAGGRLVEKGGDHQAITTTTTNLLAYQSHRQLPGWFEDFKLDGVTDSFDSMISTPVNAWDGSQWLLAAVMLLLTMWCCGCLACRRRGYGGGYRGYGNGYGNGYGGGGYPGGYYGGGPSYGQYGGRSSGGGGFSGLCGNLLMCACCYELCCRDCQDVPFINNSAKVGNGDGGDGSEYHRDAGIQIV